MASMDVPLPPGTFPGNPDLYGIGVRIGLYSSWLATLLTTIFNPRDETDLRVTNLIIQFAIFIGLCVESRDPSKSPVGSVVTQFLLCGSLSSLTGDGISYFGHLSGLARCMFYAALSGYGCWFYWRGIDIWERSGDGTHRTMPNVVFFGRSRIDAWPRTAGRVLSIVGVVVSSCLILYSLFRFYKRYSVGVAALARPQRKRPRVEIGLLVLSMGLIAFSIAVIEYLVRVNRIQGLSEVRSVGQFIPLLVGSMSAAMTMWKILVEGLVFRRRCWFLLGKHL